MPHLSPERGRRPVDRVLYETPLVTIGAFRAAVDDPLFHDSGPAERSIFVFPRTSVWIQHEGCSPFVTDPCTVTYYNAGQPYRRRPIDPRGDHCEWFSVRPDVLREMLAAFDPSVRGRDHEIFSFSHGPSDAKAYGLQRLVVRHVNGVAEPSRLAVEETTLRVLHRLLERRWAGPAERRASEEGGVGPSATEGHIAERVRLALVENLGQAASLQDIADTVGLSVFHMCRSFKAGAGTTIQRYRHELRLRRALELIAETSWSLSRIALDLGYSSHSHFTATFRRTFGVTPSRLRRTVTSRELARLQARVARGP